MMKLGNWVPVQKARQSSNVKVKRQGHRGQKNEKLLSYLPPPSLR